MLIDDLAKRMESAESKYGPFTSMHEALGVIRLEYRELEEAIQSRDANRIIAEALDLAAPCLRLINHLRDNAAMRERSGVAAPAD
jgi:hypothetical protein